MSHEKHHMNSGFSRTEYGFQPARQVKTWDYDEDIPEEERPEEWSNVCFHFTQNTTFHGVNKITESTPFLLRR